MHQRNSSRIRIERRGRKIWMVILKIQKGEKNESRKIHRLKRKC